MSSVEVSEGAKKALIARDFLHSLVERQRAILIGVPTRSPDFLENRKSLFAWLKSSEDFRRLYGELQKLCVVPRSSEQIKKVRSFFAGALYQLICERLLSLQQYPSRVVLPHEPTLEFLGRLYSSVPRVHFPFDEDTLSGISVPDSLVVESNGVDRVVGIVEFSLSGLMSHFETKNVGFEILKTNFPDVFGDAEKIFILPKGGSLKKRTVGSGFGVIETPVTHGQFRNFAEGIFKHYQMTEDSATINDILDWVGYQHSRGQEMLASGGITPEYRRHLGRINDGAF